MFLAINIFFWPTPSKIGHLATLIDASLAARFLVQCPSPDASFTSHPFALIRVLEVSDLRVAMYSILSGQISETSKQICLQYKDF
jgi:hypothetical protein